MAYQRPDSRSKPRRDGGTSRPGSASSNFKPGGYGASARPEGPRTPGGRGGAGGSFRPSNGGGGSFRPGGAGSTGPKRDFGGGNSFRPGGGSAGSDRFQTKRAFDPNRPARFGSDRPDRNDDRRPARDDRQPDRSDDRRPARDDRPRSGGPGGFGAPKGRPSAGYDDRDRAPRERSAPRDTFSFDDNGPDLNHRPKTLANDRNDRPVDSAADRRASGLPYQKPDGDVVPIGKAGERNRKFVKPVDPNTTRPVTSAHYDDKHAPASGGERGNDRRDDRGPYRPGGGSVTERFDRERFGNDRPRFEVPGREAPRPGKFGAKPNGNRGFGSDRRDPHERAQADRNREERRERGWIPEGRYRPDAPAPRPTPGSFADRRDRDGAREGVRDGARRPERDNDRGADRKDDRPRFGADSREAPREAPNYNLQRFEKGAAARGKFAPGGKKKDRDDDDLVEGIRLNRYIANAGVCSRREADSLISAGEIRVNGEIVTEMGYIVKPEDSVQYGKRSLKREKNVYVLLNKPKDYITTTDDPEERKTVMDLVGKASKERIFPVGRLDRNTTGLLLFTNDGELAQKLTHPSHRMQKIYQVELDKPLRPDDFKQIQAGLDLEDGRVEVDDVAVVNGNEKFVGVELHSGRNRVVRRIFEHLGYDVVTLDRVQYAGLTKKDLPRGNWRFLTEQEVVRLKYFQ